MVHRHLTLLLCLVPVLVTPQGTPPPSVQQPAGTLPDCPELARALTAVVRNDARLRDWPQLGRYRDANRALALHPDAKGFAIMAPVSSFTASYGARLAHAMQRRQLEIAFGIFLWLVSARLAASLVW